MGNEEYKQEYVYSKEEQTAWHKFTLPTTTHTEIVRNFLAPYSAATYQSMQNAVNRVARILSLGQLTAQNFPWEQITSEDVNLLQEVMVRWGVSAGVRNKLMTALRGVFKLALAAEHITAQQYFAVLAVTEVKAERNPHATFSPLATKDINSLLWDCLVDASPQGPRDLAMFALALTTGRTLQQIANLEQENCDPRYGIVTFPSQAADISRSYRMQPHTAQAMESWFRVRNQFPDMPMMPEVFTKVDEQGQVLPQPLLEDDLRRLMRMRMLGARIRKLDKQILRQTYAQRLYETGLDPFIVEHLTNIPCPHRPRGLCNFERSQAVSTAAYWLDIPNAEELEEEKIIEANEA